MGLFDFPAPLYTAIDHLLGFLPQYARLLLWAALSFVCLAVNNLFLVGDKVVFPNLDLLAMRQLSAVAAIGVLLYGFIWEAEV